MSEINPHGFARIRDLPVEDRRRFWAWVEEQTRPIIEDGEGNELPESEQDGYWKHDYTRWKEGTWVWD